MRVALTLVCVAILYGNGVAQTLSQTVQYISTKLEPFEYHVFHVPIFTVDSSIRARHQNNEIEIKMIHTNLTRAGQDVFEDQTVVQRFNPGDLYYNKVQEIYGPPAETHTSMAHCCVSLTINCWKPNCVSVLYEYKDGRRKREYRNHGSVIVHQRHKEAVKKALRHAVKISGGKKEPF